MGEIESLRAIYYGADEFRADEVAIEQLVQLAAEAGDLPPSLSGDVPTVTVSIRLRVEPGIGCSPSLVRLSAVLPWGYPSGDSSADPCIPVVWLEPESPDAGAIALAAANDDALCGQLQAKAQDLAQIGEECLLPLVQSSEELVSAKVDELMAHSFGRQARSSGPEASVPCDLQDFLLDDDDERLAQEIFDEELAFAPASFVPAELRAPRLGRRAMFSHHIIAPSKRQAIGQWALQLHLGGLSKIGWPGLILVEGDERNVRVYVDALSRLRWKHFVVRGEQIVDGQQGQSIDDLRALPRGFEEFGTDGVSEFAARCRQHGLEELFLICMKMRSSSPTSGRKQRSDAVSAGPSRKGKKR